MPRQTRIACQMRCPRHRGGHNPVNGNATIGDAMNLTYTVIIGRGEPGEVAYWAAVPALPGCFTDGRTLPETLSNAKEAIELYLSVLIEDGRAIPDETTDAANLVRAVSVEV